MFKTTFNILLILSGALYLVGCNVRVGGRSRPLVHYEPLESELEWVVEDRTDEQGTQNNMRKGSNTVIEERLRTKTRGDVYHPDALTYDVSLGLGLTQHDSESELDSEWSNDPLSDYRVMIQMLKKKPATVILDAGKSEDIIARQFLGSLHTERESQGAAIYYRSERWPMSLQYSNSRTTQDGRTAINKDYFSRDDERLRYSLSHRLAENQQVRVDLNRNNTEQQTTAASTQTETDNYTVSHDVTWGETQKHRLDSFLSHLDQKGAFNFQNTRWQERLRLQHHPDFSTHYDARLVDVKRETTTSREVRGLVGLEHHLYESLVTTADLFASATDLDDQGRMNQQGGTLTLNYRKNNPWGIFLGSYTAGLTFNAQSGSQGVASVIHETHIARDLEPIELNRVNIDLSSIVVTNAVGQVFQEGSDYSLTERQGRVWITTFVVGGGAPPNFTEGDAFYVDYDFYVEPQRDEETWRQSVNFRERFDNGFSLGFSHRRQREKVEATLTTVTPDEYAVNTLSADYVHRGLFLRAEFSQEDSTQVPSNARRVEGRYLWVLDGHSKTLSVRAINHWLSFEEPDKRDVTLFQGGLQYYVPLARSSSWSSSLDYRDEMDSRFGGTQGFQFDTELRYRYRDLSATVGLELNRLTRRNDEINSDFVYFRLRRTF